MIAPAAGSGAPPVVEEEEYEEREGPGRPWWAWLLAGLFVLAAVVAGIFLWQELSGSNKTQSVGLYTGVPVQQAEQQIRAAHLVPDVKPAASEKVKKGIVFRQDPQPGTKLAKGDTVTIWNSTGPPKVPVPDVKGQQWPDAQRTLQQAGFIPVEHIVPGGTTAQKNQVVATDPAAGESVAKGSKIRVNVYSGPTPVSVPSVVGQSLSQATATLHNDGFNVNPTYQDSNAPQNQVISQNPTPGSSVPKGSTINLTVSNGPPSVTIPTVVGESAGQATKDLQAAGFVVSQTFVSVSDPTQNGIVQRQNPDGGTSAPRGSTVTIEVAQYSAPGTTTGTTTTIG